MTNVQTVSRSPKTTTRPAIITTSVQTVSPFPKTTTRPATTTTSVQTVPTSLKTTTRPATTLAKTSGSIQTKPGAWSTQSQVSPRPTTSPSAISDIQLNEILSNLILDLFKDMDTSSKSSQTVYMQVDKRYVCSQNVCVVVTIQSIQA